MPSLMGKAAKELRQKEQRLASIRRQRRMQRKAAVATVSNVAGAATAGLIDAYFGDGKPYTAVGIPFNLAMGGSAAVLGSVLTFPGDDAIAAGGVGQFGAGLYAWIVQNVTFDE